MIYKEHKYCRVCNNDKMIPYLDLGQMPISNNLADSTLDPIHNQRYPLEVLFCDFCGLSQLSVVVPPEILFGHYVYRSSISKGYLDHCNKMAISLKEKYGLNDSSFHIDIAGNDGALLGEFRKVLNHRILNIDPAQNLASIAEAAKIPTLTFYWGIDTAKKIVNSHGQADLITATNVFAHVNDSKEFLEAVKYTLKPKGIFVVEFPYVVDFIDNNEFDTVYFEHLSYYGIRPLYFLAIRLGLEILRVEKQDIHGGTVRVTLGHIGQHQNDISNVVEYMINERDNYGSIEKYNEFADNVRETIRKFRDGIHSLKGDVAGFAASAKGNTLLNSAGITVGSMRYIVDETPEKIGKYSPGTRIPIVGMYDFMKTPPDYLVILSWNFAKEIQEKCRKAGYTGKFIIPIPEFKIID